jgi:hypothetical protein
MGCWENLFNFCLLCSKSDCKVDCEDNKETFLCIDNSLAQHLGFDAVISYENKLAPSLVFENNM